MKYIATALQVADIFTKQPRGLSDPGAGLLPTPSMVPCDEMRVVRVTRLAVRPLARQQGATW